MLVSGRNIAFVIVFGVCFFNFAPVQASVQEIEVFTEPELHVVDVPEEETLYGDNEEDTQIIPVFEITRLSDDESIPEDEVTFNIEEEDFVVEAGQNRSADSNRHHRAIFRGTLSFLAAGGSFLFAGSEKSVSAVFSQLFASGGKTLAQVLPQSIWAFITSSQLQYKNNHFKAFVSNYKIPFVKTSDYSQSKNPFTQALYFTYGNAKYFAVMLGYMTVMKLTQLAAGADTRLLEDPGQYWALIFLPTLAGLLSESTLSTYDALRRKFNLEGIRDNDELDYEEKVSRAEGTLKKSETAAIVISVMGTIVQCSYLAGAETESLIASAILGVAGVAGVVKLYSKNWVKRGVDFCKSVLGFGGKDETSDEIVN